MDIHEEIAAWKKEVLEPFCLDECVLSCCTGWNRGVEVTEEHVRAALKRGPEENISSKVEGIRRFDFGGETVFYFMLNPKCVAYDLSSKKCELQGIKPDECVSYPVDVVEKHSTVILMITCNVTQSDNSALTAIQDIANRHKYTLDHTWARVEALDEVEKEKNAPI
jgi:Fe-S-cluster containining protein